MVFQTQLQRHAPARMVGRVGSTFSTAQLVATVAGSLLGGVGARAYGLTATVTVALAGCLTAALLAVLMLGDGPGSVKIASGGPFRRGKPDTTPTERAHSTRS